MTVIHRTNVGIMLAVLFTQRLQKELSQRHFANGHNGIANG